MIIVRIKKCKQNIDGFFETELFGDLCLSCLDKHNAVQPDPDAASVTSIPLTDRVKAPRRRVGRSGEIRYE